MSRTQANPAAPPATSPPTTRKRGRPTARERGERRDEILDAAVRLFLDKGYQRTSIDDLVATAHVTKRTIYGYFGDKSDVFTAAVERLRARTLRPPHPPAGDTTRESPQDPAQDPVQEAPRDLETLAARITETLHSDEAVGLHRLMITEAAAFPDLADRFYRDGPRGYIAALATHIAAHPDHPAADGDGDGTAEDRAEALFTLLLGESHRRRLLALEPAPSADEAHRRARAALALLGLATPPAPGGERPAARPARTRSGRNTAEHGEDSGAAPARHTGRGPGTDVR